MAVDANDPAAPVATLLEIGRMLGAAKSDQKLTFDWFFDGEEAFWNTGTIAVLRGTRTIRSAYVEQLRARNELATTRAPILLDMMGYKDLSLTRHHESTAVAEHHLGNVS